MSGESGEIISESGRRFSAERVEEVVDLNVDLTIPRTDSASPADGHVHSGKSSRSVF